MGALPFLRPLHGQVDHIQLVEPAGFDPHVAVCIVRSHGHKIQRDSRRKAITVLVVGVVAAQLCAARCRINLHLPARPKVQLKLFQRSTVACPLPTDFLRRIAIQCPELIVPFARRDLISELRTVCHNDSSLNMLLWDRWVCYVYCNASNRFFQFPTPKNANFGTQFKE